MGHLARMQTLPYTYHFVKYKINEQSKAKHNYTKLENVFAVRKYINVTFKIILLTAFIDTNRGSKSGFLESKTVDNN